MATIAFQPNAFTSAFQGATQLGVARNGDTLNPPHTLGLLIASATTVYCDGILVALLGDAVTTHVAPVPVVHSGVTIISASSKVYANGKPLVRLTDSASCGGIVNTASSKVFCPV